MEKLIIFSIIFWLFFTSCQSADAKNILKDREYCDIIYSEIEDGDVLSEGIERQCRNRFQYLDNRKSSDETICMSNFIGTDWDIAKKYERRCIGKWLKWTREMKAWNTF